ncbi:MAG TPA: TRAP transporter small permease [Kineosporiaceae bacterium]|nr:TRAP transporter small permease [Kineosporiaceae bacterium]
MTTDTPDHRDGGLRAFLAEPPPWAARTVRTVTAVEIGIGAVALALIFFLVGAQALQRYLPFEGWAWTGELARFCLVWLTFVVAGVLVSSDSHISIEMIDAVRSPLIRRVVRVISCLTVAAVGLALTVTAWELTRDQGVLKSPALRMPMSWLYGISLIGFVSTTVRASVAALRFAVLGAPDPDAENPENPGTGNPAVAG